MDGKRHVCGTCKWFVPFTDVCTNGDSEHRADFMDQMEDTCERWEGYSELNFERDILNESDFAEEKEPEPLNKKHSGGGQKDRIQHKKPIGRGGDCVQGSAHPGQGED